MPSDEGEFWDRRYQEEGTIWGDDPSPMAQLAVQLLRPNERVLDVGFGYGRDVRFLLRNGLRAGGIDLSMTGLHQAQARLKGEGLPADSLLHGRFEETLFQDGEFDGVLSHRLAHLLITRESIARFVSTAHRVLRPNGLLFVSVRNPHDHDPAEMVEVDQGIYEYRQRPGHRIRYWDERTFRDAFDGAFQILSRTEGIENEAVSHPVPCYLTMTVARRLPQG